MVNVHKESRIAIESQKKAKEILETKNTELQQKVQASENTSSTQKSQIEALELKVTILCILIQ